MSAASPNQLRQWAEQILHSADLADKMAPPPVGLPDAQPGPPLKRVALPARPDGLAFDDPRPRTPFPSRTALQTDRGRGEVLHFFANHELLALELMALMLLRFPDAPRPFRRGLANTMAEEQRHLSLYLGRMVELGVEPGEVPINDFFWRSLSTVDSPLKFVAGMSLTFEQANLDYALYYQERFHEIGDQKTADLMQIVFEDEISHVRHGLRWLRRWRAPGQDEWTAHQRNLRHPLTPARAKGRGFRRAPRRAAGLPAAYIDRLAVYGHSKGRPPRLLYFNPGCEAEIVRGLDRIPASAEKTQQDLEALPMVLAATEDAVLVRRTPSVPHLKTLRDAGLTIPEFIVFSGNRLDDHDLASRTLSGLAPWGWSPAVAALFAPLGAPVWTEEMGRRAGKAFGVACARQMPEHDWLAPPDTFGAVCERRDAVDEAVEALIAKGHDVVIKAEWGAAGRGAIRRLGGAPLTPSQVGWLRKILHRQGRVVVEPWLDRRLDYSLHFDRKPGGKMRFLGCARFFTDRRGQYRGHWLGRFTDGLHPETIALLYGGGQDPRRWSRLARTIGDVVGEQLGDYAGPVGVDSMVYHSRRDDRLRIKPIVEVNVRWSMGRIALALQKRIRNGTPAVYRLFGPPDRKRSQIDDLAAWAAERPLRCDDGGQWRSGVICLTEPGPDRQITALVAVGDDVDALG
ncbi:MAG: DUF455 family protein [Myxococcota bacterium]